MSPVGAFYISDLCSTSLKYLRAATFESQFSIIFNSTPKITKHREYNDLDLLGQSFFLKVFNRYFSIIIKRKVGIRAAAHRCPHPVSESWKSSCLLRSLDKTKQSPCPEGPTSPVAPAPCQFSWVLLLLCPSTQRRRVQEANGGFC